MARIQTVKSNFSAGEISPILLGRTDSERYRLGAETIRNWVVLTETAVRKRYGTRYVATAKDSTHNVRLEPFIFRAVDALVLEVGHLYLRFYKNGAQVQVAGVPVEVATPYIGQDVFALRFRQKNDVVYIFHEAYQPRKLIRTSDTTWFLRTVKFHPPPTFENGHTPSASLTPGATTGADVLFTTNTSVFLPTDVDRQILADEARVAIHTYVSGTQVRGEILEAFADTSAIPAGQWQLDGSPVATVKPSKAGPVGATISLKLRRTTPGGTNLVTNGGFGSGLTSWTNYSPAAPVSGTHDGPADSALLIDSTADFLAAGVLTGFQLANTTDASQGTVATVSTTQLTLNPVLAGGTENDWDAGDAYTIEDTSRVAVVGGKAELNAGPAGVAWIEQAVTTVDGLEYLTRFDVSNQPLTHQVGSTAQGSDVLGENSYDMGNDREALFEAVGTTTYLQFRYNQPPGPARLDDVRCTLHSVEGWRSEDVGKYVHLSGGLVQITAVPSALTATGVIIVGLEHDEQVEAGAWTLEEPAWSSTFGFPRTATFHELRLLPASTARFPQAIWGSVTNDFENFARANLADHSFVYQIAEAQGPLYWLIPSQQLLIGGESGEFSMQGDAQGFLSADAPPLVRRNSTYGSHPLDPLHVGNAVLFVQRQGTKLRQMQFNDESSAFQAPDLSILSGHLLNQATLTQLAYEPEPTSMVWGVRSDGTLLGLTYDALEGIIAWHHHTTGSADKFRSLAVIPHPTTLNYQMWVVVERTIAGQPVKYIEFLSHTFHGVDSAVVYNGAATSTLTGYAHLEAETVSIAAIPSTGTTYALFEATVSGGQVTLPVPVTAAYGGLPYEATLDLLPMEVVDAPGSLQRTRKRPVEMLLRLHETGEGLVVQGTEVPLRAPGQPMDDGTPLQTGDVPVTALGWSRDGRITITHRTALPATLLGVFVSWDIGQD